MMNFKRDKIIKTIFGFSLSSWISALLNFGIITVSTRYIEPEQLAQINIFIVTVTLLMTLVSLGLDQGYMRYFHEEKTEQGRRDLLTACLFAGVIGLTVISILFFPIRNNIAYWILNNNKNELILYLFLCTLNVLVLRYISLLHRMNNAVFLFTITSICSLPLLKISYLISAAYNSQSYTAIFIMTCISSITLVLIFLFYKVELNFKVSIRKILTSDLIKFSIPLMPISFVMLLNNNIPLFLLRSLDDMTQLGIYSIAITLAGLITLLQSGLNTFWSPYVYQNYRNDTAIFMIRKMHKVIVFLMISFAIIIIMCQDAIVFLLGAKYRTVINFFPLLMISPICYTIAETTGIGIALKNKSYINLYIYVVCIVVNITFCYILIPLYSVTGAAVSTAFASVIMLILKTIFGQVYYKTIGQYRFVTVGMLIIVFVVSINILFVSEPIIKLCTAIFSLFGLSIYFNIKDMFITTINKSLSAMDKK